MSTTETGLSSGGVPQEKRRYGGQIYIDRGRLNSYTPDGSQDRPYRTIQSAMTAKLLQGPEQIAAILAGNASEMSAVPVFTLEGGNYEEAIKINGAAVVRGVNAFFTVVDEIICDDSLPIVILHNLKINKLTVTTAAALILQDCEVLEVEVTAAPLIFRAENLTIETCAIVPGSRCMLMNTNITDAFAVDLVGGDSGLILLQNSTVVAPVVSQENDEELSWLISRSEVGDGWAAQDFETIVNKNSVLGNFDQANAASYTLVTAGPA